MTPDPELSTGPEAGGAGAGSTRGTGSTRGAGSATAAANGGDDKPAESDANGPRLHALLVELAALARNGLNYQPDRYETARYERIHAITAEIMGMLSGSDPAGFRAALAAEAGHATPKVDVRGALVEDGRILLVQEARDGRWTLPGGWADAMDTPAEAVEREFGEEAGLAVRAAKLAAVHDGSRRNGHARSPWHIYKLFFMVERVDDAAPRAGLDGETTDVGFFRLDELPELSTARSTVAQLATLLAHHRDPARPTDFD
ncbi:NUDIX hydrolase N-terminal domain-containing protein [Actinopolymorpha sp. B11F2]|uniref:NUDIX hydrolase N-terminal domain-containing protein n=1 Tax=Actinopolymorpha sp. B11F2 TaxID=3160862 RepID=UPI0032E4E883